MAEGMGSRRDTIPEGTKLIMKFMKLPWKRAPAIDHFLPKCSKKKMPHSRAGIPIMLGIISISCCFTPKPSIFKVSVE